MVFGAYSIIALGFSGSAFAAEVSNFTKVLEDKGLLTITSSESPGIKTVLINCKKV